MGGDHVFGERGGCLQGLLDRVEILPPVLAVRAVGNQRRGGHQERQGAGVSGQLVAASMLRRIDARQTIALPPCGAGRLAARRTPAPQASTTVPSDTSGSPTSSALTSPTAGQLPTPVISGSAPEPLIDVAPVDPSLSSYSTGQQKVDGQVYPQTIYDETPDDSNCNAFRITVEDVCASQTQYTGGYGEARSGTQAAELVPCLHACGRPGLAGQGWQVSRLSCARTPPRIVTPGAA